MSWTFVAVELLAETTPAPTPSMNEEMTTATVTPGLPGFFVFFAMAVALTLLAIDMSRRIRKSTARETVRLRMQDQARQESAPKETSVDSRAVSDDAVGGEPNGSDTRGNETSGPSKTGTSGA